MGNNCIGSCGWFKAVDEKQVAVLEKGGSIMDGGVKKVRIVLTEAELQWFMEQLAKQQGGRSLQDLLVEMAERKREEEELTWRPVLDTIMEVPEIQSFDIPAEAAEAAEAADI